MGKTELICGEALTELAKIPDGSVELILTDPPYNINQYSTGNISRSDAVDLNNDIAEWDVEPFHPADYLPEFQRILSPTGNLFAFTGYNQFGEWHQHYDAAFDTFQFVVWHKLNPPPHLRGTSFRKSVELVICAWNKGHTWNFFGTVSDAQSY